MEVVIGSVINAVFKALIEALIMGQKHTRLVTKIVNVRSHEDNT